MAAAAAARLLTAQFKQPAVRAGASPASSSGGDGAGPRAPGTHAPPMIDPFESPFGPPAKRAAPADPFGAMPFEDRWRLASGKILGTNLGRRILGLPDRKPRRGAEMPPRPPAETASGAFAGGYEAIPGWRVPLDADLKALGLEALDNARRAGENPAPIPDAAPDPATQVRAAERLRRAAGSPQAGGKPAAGKRNTRAPLRSGRSAAGPEGAFGAGRPGRLPKAKPGAAAAPQRQPERRSRPPLTGPAAGLLPAHWRALAGGYLHAREAIKQASIGAERKHGGNRPAHDAEVAAAARREDARLPGFTEHATVLSAQRAGEKYRKNMERRPAPAGERNGADPGRATADTLLREGRHALGKAEKALDAGDRAAAEGHRRDAWLILTNAKAAQDDALKAGNALAESPAPDADADDAREASERTVGGTDSAVAPPPEGAPATGPAPAERDSAGSQPPRAAADREAPKKIGREEALARLERQFVHGPGALGATVNRRILAAATAAYASAEAREKAVRDAVRRAWRRNPAKQDKLIEAARAAAAGKTAAERRRLFLEAAAGTTVKRTLDELAKAEAGRVRRINAGRAGAAFEAWRRANPDSSETERLEKAVDLALAYGAAPEALRTTVLRRFKDRLGVQRDRHGEMTVADPDAAWAVSAALGRLHRHAPNLAKDILPGIHGFAAESVAQGRLGWNPAESDPAARAEILKRVYLDAEKKSFEAHKQGLYVLPWVGPVLAAPEAFGAGAELAGHMRRGEWDRIDAAEFATVFAPLLGGGAGAVRAAQQWLRNKRAARGTGRVPKDGGESEKNARRREKDGDRAPDPDGHDGGLDWSGRDSTIRHFDEVARNETWAARSAENQAIPTFGADRYKGRPIPRDGDEPETLIGEVRLHKDGDRSYALRLNGERKYIGRKPTGGKANEDGSFTATAYAPDGKAEEVYFNPYGLPEFPARGAFWLPPELVKRGNLSRRRYLRRHKDYVKNQLRAMAHDKPEMLHEMNFTSQQIEKMKRGVDLEDLGIRVHHDYRVGRMLIVDEHLHRLAHLGGGCIW